MLFVLSACGLIEGQWRLRQWAEAAVPEAGAAEVPLGEAEAAAEEAADHLAAAAEAAVCLVVVPVLLAAAAPAALWEALDAVREGPLAADSIPSIWAADVQLAGGCLEGCPEAAGLEVAAAAAADAVLRCWHWYL